MNAQTSPIKTPPAWQARRARLLQRICLNVKAAQARGEALGATLKRFAKYYNGRALDARHTFRLSASSLRRFWDMWRANGELPAAFALNFRQRPPTISARFLSAFVNYCATHRHESLKAAWLAFARIYRNRPTAQRVSYWMINYYFPAAPFYQMQSAMQRRDQAAADLAGLRADALAAAGTRLAEPAPRRRQRPGDAWQI